MKIHATENVYNPDNTVKTVRLFELDIPADEIRRMIESVTKAPEEKPPIPEYPDCPECGSSEWRADEKTCTLLCGKCGRVIREDEFPIIKAQFHKPAVEGSLAKARSEKMVARAHSDPIKIWKHYDNAFAAYESAICERNEKLAQSMTVEEWSRWWNEWDERKRFPPTFIDFLRQKIKERNDANKAGE